MTTGRNAAYCLTGRQQCFGIQDLAGCRLLLPTATSPSKTSLIPGLGHEFGTFLVLIFYILPFYPFTKIIIGHVSYEQLRT